RGGVTRHVGDPPRPRTGQLAHHVLTGTRTRRVQHDHVGTHVRPLTQLRLHATLFDPGLIPLPQVVAGITRGVPASPPTHGPTPRPRRLGQSSGEQTGTAVQTQCRLPRTWSQRLHHRVCERGSRGGVNLPEPARADPVLVPVHRL